MKETSNKLPKIVEIISNPKKFILFLISKGFFNWIPDKYFLYLRYYCEVGRKLNLNNPKTFNEKIQWLKLYNKNPKHINLVDKYEVRSYISEILGEEYLIPLYGVYNKFEEIDFNALPNQFVLKCTHDSGGVVICTDKSKFNIDKAKKFINKSLSRNFFYFGREWPYKGIKPRIICEKYMVDNTGNEINDYKFMCFNGEPKIILLCQNRHTKDGLNIDFYNNKWELLEVQRPNHPSSMKYVKKPINFNLMLEYAKKLSKDEIFVRIDFYEINGKLYFGEITFYPGSGFEKFHPDKYDEYFGDWIELNQQ